MLDGRWLHAVNQRRHDIAGDGGPTIIIIIIIIIIINNA